MGPDRPRTVAFLRQESLQSPADRSQPTISCKEKLCGNRTSAVRHPVLQAMGFGSLTFPWTCAQGKL